MLKWGNFATTSLTIDSHVLSKPVGVVSFTFNLAND